MKKNIVIFSISLVVILLLGIGVSYSLWNISVSQNTVNTATTKCFNVEITSQKNSISLENAYPITNEKGKKLTPFSFTITNTCDIFASYTVSLESLKDTTLSSKFINAMINNEEIKKLSDYEATDTVNTGSIESHILAKGSLGSGDSEDYTLRVWIDYDTTMEDLDNETKTFKSKVVVKAEPSSWSPVDKGYTTLHDAILANEYQSSPEVAIKKIEAKVTPDLSKTAPLLTWREKTGDTKVIHIEKPDTSIIGKAEFGTSNLNENSSFILVSKSYYFNNDTGKYNLTNTFYVDPTAIDTKDTLYFCGGGTETNKINGNIEVYDYSDTCSYLYRIKSATKSNNSSINTKNYRIMYDITSVELTSEEYESDNSNKGLYESEDNFGKSFYYRGSVKNNNVMLAGFYWKIIRINGDDTIRLLFNGDGKTYDNIGKSIFNENSDPAYVGYMYGNNIGSRENNLKNEVNSIIKNEIDSWYEQNIKLNNYDSIISDSGFCNDRTIYNGNGYSTKVHTIFGPYGRYINNTASFKCFDKDNDLFTTINSTFGNKALTYPVGLITYDELVYAGMNNNINLYSYVYSKNEYWTMSPSKYDMYYQITLNFSSNNTTNFWANVTLSKAIRPVINLKADVKISGGIGTVNDPYVVE